MTLREIGSDLNLWCSGRAILLCALPPPGYVGRGVGLVPGETSLDCPASEERLKRVDGRNDQFRKNPDSVSGVSLLFNLGKLGLLRELIANTLNNVRYRIEKVLRRSVQKDGGERTNIP